MLLLCASRIIAGLVFLNISGASLALADTFKIHRIAQTEQSIVSVQTELVRQISKGSVKKVVFKRNATGVIIDSSGIILTNTHTIIHAPLINVILADGTRLKASRLFTSKKYDFSFLRVYPAHPLKSIPWANSRFLRVGSPVIVIKSPNHGSTLLMPGHILTILHSNDALGKDFLELDISCHHGDSGSPVVNTKGQLLGIIMAARLSKPNVSIAIASNKIRRQYLQYKKILR